MSRREDLDHLYALLAVLENRIGRKQRLSDCTGYMDWPDRGVYFFFAADEQREETNSLRLTRIGTHAVSAGSSTSLWNRLRTHRGANSGTYEDGGNHRGSVFRKRVWEAMIERDGIQNEYPYWGEGPSADRERRLSELLEFEKYDGVAEARMEQISEELAARDGVQELRMHHRTGVVEAGEDIV